MLGDRSRRVPETGPKRQQLYVEFYRFLEPHMTSQNQDKTGFKMNLKMRPLPDARSYAGGWLLSLIPEPRASRLYVDISISIQFVLNINLYYLRY